MKRPFIITFAGVPGSSKSIIAYHLSTAFNLPIFSTDNLRFEVKEDLLVNDIRHPVALEEFKRRQAERFRQLLERKQNFIRDGSIDRRWAEIKKQLLSSGYSWFVIDIELSKDFLISLYTKTGRTEALGELDIYFNQHASFMMEYDGDISLKITDKMFLNRNSLAEAALGEFIKKLSP